MLSKKDAIYEALEELGVEAEPHEVRRWIKKRYADHLVPSTAYVYVVRSWAVNRKRLQPKEPPRPTAEAPSSPSGVNVTAEELTALGELCSRLGGVDRARRVLNLLAG